MNAVFRHLKKVYLGIDKDNALIRERLFLKTLKPRSDRDFKILLTEEEVI